MQAKGFLTLLSNGKQERKEKNSKKGKKKEKRDLLWSSRSREAGGRGGRRSV